MRRSVGHVRGDGWEVRRGREEGGKLIKTRGSLGDWYEPVVEAANSSNEWRGVVGAAMTIAMAVNWIRTRNLPTSPPTD